jgi:DNA-3-methyladenine glycosylase II
LLATPDADLRALGLSRQKILYIKDLSGRVEGGRCTIDALHELEEQAILDMLIQIKGIGRWTVQMFLMFRLGRLDVLPELDLGIQKAVGLAYGLGGLATPRQVQQIGARWSPYATIACWYLWRSLELPAAAVPAGSGEPAG